MKLVCISDTHGQHRALDLPEGDVLIHAGDFCHLGTEAELIDFDDWLGTLNFEHKLVVLGNHDDVYGDDYELQNGLIIGNKVITIGKIRIGGLNHFNPLKPHNLNGTVEVLVSHEPPFGFYGKVGDIEVTEIADKLMPLAHIFGHLHHYGTQELGGRTYINAALCDMDYDLTNKAIILEF